MTAQVIELLVIELWPTWCTCQRCDVQTLDRFCWPYYEDFIRTDSPGPHGFVPVCEPCHDWLEANEATLERRDCDGAVLP